MFVFFSINFTEGYILLIGPLRSDVFVCCKFFFSICPVGFFSVSQIGCYLFPVQDKLALCKQVGERCLFKDSHVNKRHQLNFQH